MMGKVDKGAQIEYTDIYLRMIQKGVPRMLEVVLLGTGGTMPLRNRWLTACWMRSQGSAILIDCGEGTQIAMKAAGVSFTAIELLCLTHYHADHVSGLPGLLLSMGNEGRTAPLTIAGPQGLQRIVDGLRVIAPELPFPLVLQEWQSPVQTIQAAGMTITAFAVLHTLPCFGYRIHLPRAGKFDPVRAKAQNIPMAVWSILQKQPTADYEGILYHQEQVLGPPRAGLTVTYCTDSRPLPQIAKYAENADLFLCEGMYGDPTKQEKALETLHMTFAEAAQLAADAKAKALWLTHYSPSMQNPFDYLPNAQAIYPNAQCGEDGMRIQLQYCE